MNISPPPKHFVLVNFSAKPNILQKMKRNSQEEGFVLALDLRIHSLSWQKGMVAGSEAAGHIESTIRKLREMNYWVQVTVSFYLSICVSVEARSGCQIPWSWRYRGL